MGYCTGGMRCVNCGHSILYSNGMYLHYHSNGNVRTMGMKCEKKSQWKRDWDMPHPFNMYRCAAPVPKIQKEIEKHILLWLRAKPRGRRPTKLALFAGVRIVMRAFGKDMEVRDFECARKSLLRQELIRIGRMPRY